MDFCNKLQFHRKQAGLTQDEFALKIGVSRQAISKWESGNAYPDINNIQTICSFFLVSADTMMNPKYEAAEASAARFRFNESELGNNIRRIRTSRGITQEVFAEKMLVSRQSVSKWENGTVIPKTEIIISMLGVLDAEFTDLIPVSAVFDDTEKNETEEKGESTPCENAAENSSTQKKRSRVWIAFAAPLIIAIVAVTAIAAVLFAPFMNKPSFAVDVSEFIFGAEDASALAERIDKEGAEIVLGAGDGSFDFRIQANGEFIAFTGLGEEKAVLIPQKNTAQALENSVFNPNGNTQFSLTAENYNALIYIIRLLSAEEGELEGEFQKILGEFERIAPPSESYSFAKDKFALEKTVSYKLDKQALAEFIAVISKETKNNMAFEAFCRLTGIYEMLPSMEKSLKKEVKTAELYISYKVLDGKIISADYAYGLTYNDNTVLSSSFAIKQTSGDTPGFEVIREYSENINGIYISTSQKYVCSRDDFANGAVLRVDCVESSETKIDGMHTEKYTLESNYTLEYNSETHEYKLFYKVPETETEEKIFGIWELDAEAGKFVFSVDYIEIDNEAVTNGNTFSVSVAALGEAEFPEGENLFGLSLEEMRDIYKNLPLKQLESFIESLTGIAPEFIYSEEGKLVPSEMGAAAEKYAEAFSEYYKAQSEEVQRFDTRSVYIYNEKYDVYVILTRTGATVTSIRYAYEPSEIFAENCHPATVADGKLSVHNVSFAKSVGKTCTSDGYDVYSCNICKKEYTVATVIGGCEYEAFLKEAVWDNGKTYTASIEKCSICGKVSYFSVEDENGIWLINAYLEQKNDGTYKLAYYICNTNTENIFSVPGELFEGIALSEMENGRNGRYRLVRIPEGVKVIEGGSFLNCDDLQTIILPSTVAKIEDGAFAEAPALRTVYFCGTEEEWARVDLGAYAEKWARADVIFAPEGVSPEAAAASIEAAIE